MKLRELYQNLKKNFSNIPDHELDLVLQAALHDGKPIDSSYSRNDLFLKMSEEVGLAGIRFSQDALEKRSLGIPIQHILGFQEFLDERYFVSSEVLIPRFETEYLVREFIEDLKKDPPKRGIEVGLGSGVISLSLLKRFKDLVITASEVSEVALEVALQNLKRQAVRDPTLPVRLETALSSSPSDIDGPFSQFEPKSIDFVFSNPPYLSGPQETTLEVTNHEPQLALFAPQDDLGFYYREIARLAKKVLKPNGLLAFEIPHERAEVLMELIQNEGFSHAEFKFDLTQRKRGITARI